ncbi:MAG: KilA-N domain-containing protein [bacterium]|nr:KilA-N domain-containing protein [bacterium]
MGKKKGTLVVKGAKIKWECRDGKDFISLTDITRAFKDEDMLKHWLNCRNTIEFMGTWEQLNNPEFKENAFRIFLKQAWLERFELLPTEWLQNTAAVGLFIKKGAKRTELYAHRDIAFEFGSWLSPEFKLHLVTRYRELQREEYDVGQLKWEVRRTLTRINYRLHTDAVQKNLVAPDMSKDDIKEIYREEANMLNTALFGLTAEEWRERQASPEGNMRDNATLEQLVILTNLESINSLLIKQEMPIQKRRETLKEFAAEQIKSLFTHFQNQMSTPAL